MLQRILMPVANRDRVNYQPILQGELVMPDEKIDKKYVFMDQTGQLRFFHSKTEPSSKEPIFCWSVVSTEEQEALPAILLNSNWRLKDLGNRHISLCDPIGESRVLNDVYHPAVAFSSWQEYDEQVGKYAACLIALAQGEKIMNRMNRTARLVSTVETHNQEDFATLATQKLKFPITINTATELVDLLAKIVKP